ncbi:DTW domain-containing protein [Vibrio sp. S17_S38]|uniref:tRNA-uridine aminocarboxypropyltransferase n=1 Tax=Vibrio sp. S17_S38 TaxID=2720229 RepID=UPI0016809E02|nr:tRNA-uridine aminocarboxypropyltransferase [Vibrio sp. S17_S38]MBD1571791.1 DTW domain-containing protein [Vibrio sp. S17_S38]
MSRYCLKCGKANLACICRWITFISNETEVVILQHPSEAKRPMGTAKILALSLSNCVCFVGEDFSQHNDLNSLLDDADVESAVLYPGAESIEIDDWLQQYSLKPNNIGQYSVEKTQTVTQLKQTHLTKSKKRLILLDGTWKKAYKIWQLSTNLHSFVRVQLPENLEGNYRIRKAPSIQHLSTVEAGYYGLQLIEPSVDFSPLIHAFEQMVDFHISQMPDGVFDKNYK